MIHNVVYIGDDEELSKGLIGVQFMRLGLIILLVV